MNRCLRIVTWNCRQEFRAKLPSLAGLNPDIAIVPECCTPELLAAEAPLLMPESAAWVGDNDRKGLGVFGYGEYNVELDRCHDPELTWIAPVRVTGPIEFHLLAVWVLPAKARSGVSPIAQAINRFGEFITGGQLAVAGDFNHNAHWDSDSSWSQKHAPTVECLSRLRLVSAYHETRGERQGEEIEPTYHWRPGQTYHIDYCFVPQEWPITEHTIGDADEWSSLSDHLPLLTVCNVNV
jgi:hypothetical protein